MYTPRCTICAYVGYLSDSPCEFFLELLEYLASMVEQGVSPDRAIQTNLPNLFGPVFGTRSHAVSCRVLEYGYLSVCSRHQFSSLSVCLFVCMFCCFVVLLFFAVVLIFVVDHADIRMF